MHGEYKVPGGKLVVVDLEERDGRIADFHLAGDFFLEPDSALADIDAAVERTAHRDGCRGHRVRGARGAARGGAAARIHTGRGRHGRAPGARDGTGMAGLRLGDRARATRLAPDEPGAGRGAHEPGRRRSAPTDPAPLGVGRVGRRHRIVPVVSQRGGPRRCGTARVRRRAAHLGRRRDAHGGQLDRDLLAVRPGIPRRGHDVRRLVRLPRRLGAAGAALARASRPHISRSTTSRAPRARSAAPRRSGSRTAECCTTPPSATTWTAR